MHRTDREYKLIIKSLRTDRKSKECLMKSGCPAYNSSCKPGKRVRFETFLLINVHQKAMLQTYLLLRCLLLGCLKVISILRLLRLILFTSASGVHMRSLTITTDLIHRCLISS